jgi:hypothetical protein
MGILPGSAQSLISGNAQYHRPFSLHLSGVMLLHLTSAGVALITKLIGSANTFCSVENRWNLIGAVGVGPWENVRRLTPGHVHRRPIAVDLMSSPEHLHETVGILHPCDALQPRVSNLLRSSHISAFTWRIVSCSVIVALTCKKLNSDSNLVNSASIVTMLNLPDTTSICSIG